MAAFKVSTIRLKKNMIITRNVYSPSGTIIVPENTRVTEKVIKILLNNFVESVVAEYWKENVPETPSPEAAESAETHYKAFLDSFQKTSGNISSHIKRLVFGNDSLNVTFLLDQVNGLIEKTDNNLDLFNMLSRIQQVSTDVYSHLIRVSLLAQMLANWISLEKKDLDDLLLSCLLHDIGILKLPESFFEGKTSKEIYDDKTFTKHVIYGYNLLRNAEIEPAIKQVVLTHHERLDGSGYPLQLSGCYINQLSRIVAIVDTYDRLMGNQAEDGTVPSSPFQIASFFIHNGKARFDPNIFMAFWENILNYLIGRSVQLNNGTIGEIILLNKNNPSRPLLHTATGFLDLSVHTEYEITKVL